jgi:hypothetical protein
MAESSKPPPSDDDEPRASFTDDDRDFPMPHESRSWITGRKRKVSVLRVDPDTLPKAETKPEPPSEQTDVEKATDATNDALTERNEQSPAIQKTIADEVRAEVFRSRPLQRDQVADLVDGINLRRREKLVEREEALARERQANQPPQAYRTPIEMLKAAAIAEAEEEARQKVRQRYRQRHRPEREDLVAKMLDSNELRRREKLAEREEARERRKAAESKKSFWDKLWGLTESNLFWGGGVSVALIALGFRWANAPPKLTILLLFIAWLVISISVYRHGFFELRSRFVQVIGNMVISAIIAATFVAAWVILQPSTQTQGDSQRAATDAAMPSPSSVTSLTGLHEYFDQEVNNGLRKTLTQNVKIKDQTVPVQIRLSLNFEDRAEWLAFYIPDISEADTFQVCTQLLNDYEKAIRLFVQEYQGKIELGPIGGRMTQVKDLRFTGYIRFYHETTLNQSELDLLTEKARKKGLSIEFRGTYYQMSRMPKIN